jgi:hypothetical protein
MEYRELVLTRYLYNKIQVISSFMMSIFDHRCDEALFWGYELYYSGFKNKVFQIIIKLYEEAYKENNKKLEDFIFSKYEEWKKNKKNDCIIGSLIMTISLRDFDMENFMMLNFHCYFPKENENDMKENNKKKKKIIINFTEENLEKYKTVKVQKQAWKVLRNVCKYPIRNYGNKLFNLYIKDDIEYLYNNHWLYYASHTPVWKDRIINCQGCPNEDTKELVFVNEEIEEIFYDSWNYEFDEQSRELKDKIIGDKNQPQITAEEFYNLFVKKQPLQKQKKEEKYEQEELKNSMVYV